MMPNVPKALYEAVRALVGGKAVRDVPLDPSAQRVMTYVADDVVHYQLQMERLEENGHRPHVAMFRNAGADGTTFPILIRIPGLESPGRSQDFMLELLKRSEISVQAVDKQEARDVFTDRLAEFVAVAAAASQSPVVADTIVNSNRGGDVVLYAKGYFVSTGTAFGTSSGCRRQLIPSAQYSFGIVDNGTRKFENVLWTTPATVTLKLP